MNFLVLILASGLGFGTACFIFATLLSNSNNIGNSVGSASTYSGGVVFDRREDRISSSVRDSFGVGYIRGDEANRMQPASDRMVVASERLRNGDES